ncbi:Riboflavin transporter RfnT [Thermoflexales bacterium]|nr:Riboflavin transporter RfnT [Thermoflexales bacterium]
MTLSTPSSSLVRRLITVLFIGQGLALIALFTTAAIGSISGVQLAGTERAAGWPATAQLLGGTFASYIAGRVMNRFGRRIGLALGYVVGIAGGLMAGLAVMAGSFGLFMIGMLLLGAARATSEQSRYAAADVSPAPMRSRAVSIIVFAGTIGAVLGPAITPLAGRLAETLGFDQLAGPWFVNAALMLVTLLFIFTFLRPDPRDVARRMHADAAETRSSEQLPPARSFRQVLADPLVGAALISLGLAQAVMVMVMNITPVHMTHFAHGLEDISLVISMHILGMYGLSVVTGWISDRWGRAPTILIGSLLLIVACVLAPTNSATLPLAASLFLLGLGWNFCFVTGSALLTDRLAVNERPSIQGSADLVVGAASVIGSLGSGELMASAGYGAVNAIGIGVALIILVAVVVMRRAPAVLRESLD